MTKLKMSFKVSALSLCTFLLASFAVQAQTDITSAFTDANFRLAVRTALGLDMGQAIMDDNPGFTSVTTLNASNRGIASLDGLGYFTALQTLDCSGNNLSALPNLPNGLKVLNCSNNQLTALPALTNVLTHLYCGDNQLITLPNVPPTLTELGCGNNQLTVLPGLTGILTKLDCHNNQLSELPTLAGTLEYLNCSYNNLSALPTLGGSVVYLNCSHNQLPGFPELAGGLKYFNCSYNKIAKWNGFGMPTYIDTVDCSHNLLVALPVMPLRLEMFDCSYNKLKTLPTLCDILYFDCSHNALTALPLLVPSFEYFDCSNNQLTGLPSTSGLGAMRVFNCSNNQLTALFTLPGTGGATVGVLEELDCSNNQMGSLSGGRFLIGEINKTTGKWEQYGLPSTLVKLNCASNNLDTLDITAASSLAFLDCRLNYMVDENKIEGTPPVSLFFTPQRPLSFSISIEEHDVIGDNAWCSVHRDQKHEIIGESITFSQSDLNAFWLGDSPSNKAAMVRYVKVNGQVGLDNWWTIQVLVNGYPSTTFDILDDPTWICVDGGNTYFKWAIYFADLDANGLWSSRYPKGAEITFNFLTANGYIIESIKGKNLPSVEITGGSLTATAFPAEIGCVSPFDFEVTTNGVSQASEWVLAKIELSEPSIAQYITVEFWETNSARPNVGLPEHGTLEFDPYGTAVFGRYNPGTGFPFTGNTSYFRLINKGNAPVDMPLTVTIHIQKFADFSGNAATGFIFSGDPLATLVMGTTTITKPASMEVVLPVPAEFECGENPVFSLRTDAGCYEGAQVNAKIKLSDPNVADHIIVDVYETPAHYDNGNGTPNLLDLFQYSTTAGEVNLNPVSSFAFTTGAETFFRITNKGTAPETMNFEIEITIYEVQSGKVLVTETLKNLQLKQGVPSIVDNGNFPKIINCNGEYDFSVGTITGCSEGMRVRARVEIDPAAAKEITVVYWNSVADYQAGVTPSPLSFNAAGVFTTRPFAFTGTTVCFRITSKATAATDMNLNAAISIYEAANTSNVLATHNLGTAVIAKKGEPTVVINGDFSKLLLCDKDYDFSMTSSMGCYDGEKVIAKVSLSNIAAADEITLDGWNTEADYNTNPTTPDFTVDLSSGSANLPYTVGDEAFFRLTNKGVAASDLPFSMDFSLYNVLSGPAELVSPYTSNGVSWPGISFDMKAGTQNVTITGIEPRFYQNGSNQVYMYYRTGSANGNLSSNAGWTFIGQKTVNVVGNYAYVEFDAPVIIPAGETYGFYFRTQREFAYYTYPGGGTLADVFSTVSVSNDDLSISRMVATYQSIYDPMEFNYYSIAYPRAFVGKIHYEVTKPDGAAFATYTGETKVLAYSKCHVSESINFTWAGNKTKCFNTTATNGEDFLVEWGDDQNDAEVGTGNTQAINHIYDNNGSHTVSVIGTGTCTFTGLYVPEMQITDLNLSEAANLQILYCENNKISNLILPSGSITQPDGSVIPTDGNLNFVQCYNNSLSLLDLYNLSERVSNAANKRLGTQTLAPIALTALGNNVDFSEVEIIGSEATIFTVDGGSDYVISGGIITFNETGIYTITMTNPAIVSHPNYPAQVIVTVTVTR